MAEFVRNLGSPAWWIGVVIVGILINLISAYVKPHLDRSLATVSSKRRLKLDRQRQEYEVLVELLASNTEELGFVVLSELRHRLRCIMVLLFSLYVLLFVLFEKSASPGASLHVAGLNIARIKQWADIGVLAFASFLMFIGYLEFILAIKDKRLLFEVHERHAAERTDQAGPEQQ